MFSESSQWQEFVDAIWEITSVQNNYVEESECKGVLHCRSFGNKTLREAIDTISTANGWENEWSIWLYYYTWDILDTNARSKLIEMIAREAPATWAAIIFCREKDLTDTDDEVLLQAMREGKTEYYLAKHNRGELSRAKNIINDRKSE